MRIDLAIKKCLDNGVKVYPVNNQHRMYIEADINGKTKRFPKQVTDKELNEALTKTYQYYAQKL